ncbi:MAG: deoxyribodipyrimidine photo-lyase/cryptochrome family protein [Myxococcales bacterium]|nr:deoxyribodipyrimidine photo-lyase/cryptochrome family protein [Myxococcales bacterium]
MIGNPFTLADARPGLQVVWFKRDLRVRDHRPLVEAAARGPVICLYVYEPELLAAPDCHATHLAFIDDSLAELDRNLRTLGVPLTLRVGAMPDLLERLHRAHPVGTLWSHEETGNHLTFQRDLRVAAWARARRVPWVELVQTGVVRRLVHRDGWSRRWHARMSRPLLDPPRHIRAAPVDPQGRRTLAELGHAPLTRVEQPTGGERAAHATLASFLDARGQHYRRAMSSPLDGWTACSRLSPHLAWGTLSARQAFQAQRQRRAEHTAARKASDQPSPGPGWAGSLASFEKRLSWRCHFMQKLEDQPDIEHRNLARAYDGLRDEQTPDPQRLQAWIEGRTGYPMVDACMRAVAATGWLNFRMRAMVMSFAAYHLWLHWREPALHLARCFTDYEPGIHYCQAQMQSGTTGINALRIYSPAKQARDQDPQGAFIARWVPELAGVPPEYRAEPHHMPHSVQAKAGCVIGRDYPAPIVDHAVAVRAAKQALYAVRGRAETRAEAQRVYQKHGSRKRPAHQRPALKAPGPARPTASPTDDRQPSLPLG